MAIIVSRHQSAIEFIRREAPSMFADAPVVEQARPEDVAGKIVAGNLPLNLAALAAEVWAVEFSGQPPRGQEYSLADMDAAGARLGRYRAIALPLAPEPCEHPPEWRYSDVYAAPRCRCGAYLPRAPEPPLSRWASDLTPTIGEDERLAQRKEDGWD